MGPNFLSKIYRRKVPGRRGTSISRSWPTKADIGRSLESGDLNYADFDTEKNGSERLYPAPASEETPETENAPDLTGRGHSLNMEHETRFELATLTLAT